MAGSTKRSTNLSRGAIIARAVSLADAEGIDRLSMRRLGETLGVEAMSLYHHVPNKTALLDEMVDSVFAEISLPSGDWRSGLGARARSQRTALHRHPWALPLLESRSTPGLANLRHHDAVLGYLRGAGFGVRDAGHAYALLDAFVFGFVVQELALPFDAESAAGMAASMLEGQVGTAQPDHGQPDHGQASWGFPHLKEFMREVVMPGGYDFADEFEVGLGLVLESVASLRPSGEPAAPSEPRLD
ncbi:TetR/AcrR family transcriptional regulator [Sinomonas sp. P47F7]|uniref:TetR/AcrR family transcriptional regulator n=1 Tax=Sinomonas sp. P47F7 TaxID=3410987 RepID=UPI003BF5EEC0